MRGSHRGTETQRPGYTSRSPPRFIVLIRTRTALYASCHTSVPLCLCGSPLPSHLASCRLGVNPCYFDFPAPVTDRMYFTSSSRYGVPSVRKMSWNHSLGSAAYGFFHESQG